jgi:dephospho-CoA kinase
LSRLLVFKPLFLEDLDPIGNNLRLRGGNISVALLVGLTGGIGSGKSTASRFFRDLGVHIVDADEIARAVVKPMSWCWKEIVEIFSPDILQTSGELDRRKLAGIIFADPEKKRALEGIVHPCIADEVDRGVAELCAAYPDGIIMVDAALMIEVGRYKKFEKIIVVFADEETQVRRIMERDLIGRNDAFLRIAGQMPLAEKIGYADYVIDNNGAPETTKAEVERLYAELEKIRAGKE